MPSDKKQFGCRPDDETWARIERLKPLIAKSLGLAKISDSQLLRLALVCLEQHDYPPPAKKTRRSESPPA